MATERWQGDAIAVANSGRPWYRTASPVTSAAMTLSACCRYSLSRAASPMSWC